jgi:NAD(P)-dependent dehydrogenase (short-subunit alcohol dehydrogenase family)
MAADYRCYVTGKVGSKVALGHWTDDGVCTAPTMELRGKRVLITGASRGIGESLAHAFAGAGGTVVLVARTKDALRSLAAELGGTAHPADLSDPTQVATLVNQIEDEAGPIDVLVNNAGVGTPAYFGLPRRIAPAINPQKKPRRKNPRARRLFLRTTADAMNPHVAAITATARSREIRCVSPSCGAKGQNGVIQ